MKTMPELAPPFTSRLAYVGSAWGVALLAVSPFGLAIFAFPLGLGFILLGIEWGMILGWLYYLCVTFAIFSVERHRAFRYTFYLLIISLTANVGGCYKIANQLGRD
jgi:hypothetical protein